MPVDPHTRIYLAGHRGLVGGAVLRALRTHGYEDLVLRTHAELDLTDQAATRAFFAAEQPELVILAAARVGGILANSEEPYEFIHDNLVIQLNVIDAAFRHGVRRLLFLGRSCSWEACIYPKLAPQPLKDHREPGCRSSRAGCLSRPGLRRKPDEQESYPE
jgi:GDP-L-fucose synthase